MTYIDINFELFHLDSQRELESYYITSLGLDDFTDYITETPH